MVSSSFKTSLGKKLIAVALCVTAFVFLSISVFADTPVQPLQVITYSDTTTNVRISGTAERLHYNIDSFQVVFMNPPNNYGTSCTPILVSFRFYNASDIPAYVGQPEFELTATTSTGSVNTIIYGYDQISSDLFVAESSYSTAEVGRIGIGASNDFAYYTGFVIPPRTSLYFSCIVYVNASAYAQNNTGATEDVNQVTLSSLNLYTNQISFSNDYPYYNQPVDFTDVIQAISDLSDNVSTSSEMQNIISLLTYSGSNYNVNIPNLEFTTISANYNDVYYRVDRYVGRGRLVNTDFEIDTSSDTTMSSTMIMYPVIVVVTSASTANKGYITPTEFRINNVFTYGTAELVGYGSQIFDYIVHANYLILNFKNRYDSWRSIVPGNTVQSYFIFNMYFKPTDNISMPTMSFQAPASPYPRSTDEYVPFNEYQALRDLVNAYNQVNGLNDIDNTTDDIKDKSESAHTQEQSYFTQNAQAIQATGLSNYRFNGDQENGIGSVSHDFMLLWNSLGGFNSIYIFSLTLSLALMILRHAPNAIKSSRRNKEE